MDFLITDTRIYSIKNSYLVVKMINGRLSIINTHGWKGEMITISMPCERAEIMPDYEGIVFYSQGHRHELVLYGKFGCILKGQHDIDVQYHKRCECPVQGWAYEANNCMRSNGAVLINDSKSDSYLWAYPLQGKLDYTETRTNNVAFDHFTYHIHTNGGTYEVKFVASYEYGVFIYRDDEMDFQTAKNIVHADFTKWRKQYPYAPKEWVYTLWMNFVGRHGILPTSSQYAGKGGMCALWSWDNLFTALTLSGKFNDLAFDIFMLPYRFLCDNGNMFDFITDTTVNYHYTKPPIHGFMYAQMMKRDAYFQDKERIRQVVEPMRKNTEYWLYHRAEEPCYMHGNDSTCDNATCFDTTCYASTPDLYALLSAQCDTLSALYAILEESENERHFAQLSIELAGKIENFIIGKQLSVKSIETQEYLPGRSLFLYRAFLVFDKLSEKAKAIFKNNIQTFETKYGFASEPVDSELYDGAGYWRGAVWAPDQFLMAL